MSINDIITYLESIAPTSLQESYDNAGLITGDPEAPCSGVLCALDATEEVIREAREKKCNLVVAHHPILFSGLKKMNSRNYVEKALLAAIKNDIAIYAVHTNLDNLTGGVNGKIASLVGLENISVLLPRANSLKKLYTFVPVQQAEQVRNAIFLAGSGQIGNYSECSFNTEGTGTYKAGAGSNPFAGKPGERHAERETRIEVIFPSYLEQEVVRAMKAAHPYEEVAYDVVELTNPHPGIGSGLLGHLPESLSEREFLQRLKDVFRVPVVRHTAFLNKGIKKLAICGGAGSFLISKALASGADAYITADIKYHEFFDANGRMLLCDIGHYESEQYTIDLLQEVLARKFPTFAILKTEVVTNPVRYF